MDIGGALNNAIKLAGQAEALGRNTIEYLRYGGLKVDPESSPFAVVHETPDMRLRRYFPDDVPPGLPALLLVPPLMMMAEVYDVAPRSSSVRAVHEAGIDVWVVDFGRPEATPGGLERDVAAHVIAVSDAIDAVREATGRDVVVGGYSQGGMFSYQAVAYRRCEGVDSVIAFGSPVDFAAAPMPIPLSADSFASIAKGALNTGLVDKVSLPGWFNRSATRLLDPIKSVQFELAYLRQLHDREKLLPGEQQRMFLAQEGWTAYAGPAFKDLLENFVVTNRLLGGGLVIGDRSVSLADLTLPMLIVIGDVDKEGHPKSVRSILQAAPRAEIYQMILHTGHFGIVAGGSARRWTWPRVADWIRWRADQGDLPEVITPARDAMPTAGWHPGDVAQRVQSTADLGVDVVRTVFNTATDAGNLAYGLIRDRAGQLPLLNRIEALRPETAVSLGLLLDEAAGRDPQGAALLYGDRVLRQVDVQHRVDSVVKGLISVGVRPGERVGVLMASRPSAFSVIAAISRIGAAAVLLRPNGDLAREIALGEVTTLISDPEHVLPAQAVPGVRWCVLGGGSGERSVPEHVIDMEAIDPGTIAPPAWYRPNPTRAADIAFVLFVGDGEQTRPQLITNRRWALSALATASAASLKPSHTVYSVTPLHHSSALLMAVAGAVASGARLALSSAPDVDVFWEEVRRYGATHVSYNWASLRAVANGPEHPNEHHHPIQQFMGSGMPPNLWRRVVERFAPARVLEFYASVHSEAILANITGERVGSVGRPVPGAARVKVAAFDAKLGRVEYGPDGLARECDPGEPGLLLAKYDSVVPGRDVLRSVFTADDAWQSTHDIFIKSAAGEYWFVDTIGALIPTKDGLVAPRQVVRTLQRIPCVDLATAYGVPADGVTVMVAAVTLHPGSQLSGWDLSVAMRRLPPSQRPQYVRVVSDVPVAPDSRPDWSVVTAGGMAGADDVAVWERGVGDTAYELMAR